MGPRSEYYELALYKLGWTLYKQDFYEDALHQYMALLDYKLSIGYDFDQRHEEEDERRVADTFRVISLSFSNLGGTEVCASTSRPTERASTRTASTESRRVLPREASLSGRGDRVRVVRRSSIRCIARRRASACA